MGTEVQPVAADLPAVDLAHHGHPTDHYFRLLAELHSLEEVPFPWFEPHVFLGQNEGRIRAKYGVDAGRQLFR